MLILGPRFEGKSTFVSGCPKTLILDYEDGAWGVPDNVNRAVRIKVKDHALQDKIIAQLEADSKLPTRPFTRVAIDTADRWLIQESAWLANEQKKVSPEWQGKTIEEWGTKGAGVSILSAHCMRFLEKLEVMGYAWTIIGHIRETTTQVGGEDRTVTRPSIYPSVATMFANNADVVAVVEATTVQVPRLIQVEDKATKVVSTIDTGVKDSVMRIVFDASVQEVGFGAGTGKVRGVTSMRLHTILPPLSEGKIGWDTVCDAYTTETKRIKEAMIA